MIVISIGFPMMDIIMTVNFSNELKFHAVCAYIVEEGTLEANLSDPVYQNMLKKYNMARTEKDIRNLRKLK